MRQGTAPLPKLPQLLFNCLLIYLIMAATRASGQAASVLFLKQLSALRLLVLDIPPSLLDLHQNKEQPFCVPTKEQRGAMGGCREEAQDRRDLIGTKAGEASPSGFSSQIQTKAPVCIPLPQISNEPWHVLPNTD